MSISLYKIGWLWMQAMGVLGSTCCARRRYTAVQRPLPTEFRGLACGAAGDGRRGWAYLMEIRISQGTGPLSNVLSSTSASSDHDRRFNRYPIRFDGAPISRLQFQAAFLRQTTPSFFTDAMAPRAELHVSDTIRSSLLDRTTLPAFGDTIKPAARRHSTFTPRAMVLAPVSRAAVVARSESVDAGVIAGAVVGSVLGGALVFLILGFLYFRYKRKSLQTATDTLSRRVSFPRQGDSQERDQAQSLKDGTSERGVPVFTDGPGFHQSPQSTERNDALQAPAASEQHAYVQDYDPSPSGRTSVPFSEGQGTTTTTTTLSMDCAALAAAASYYDETIPMDSDPEVEPMAPPSRQMTELYREQLRLAREKRKERKNSKGSTISRVLNSMKRKRSTHSSDVTHASPVQASPVSDRQADLPLESIEGPSGVQPEPGQPRWDMSAFTSASKSASIYEEPQQISDAVETNHHQKKKSKRKVDSQDTFGVPHRLDSLRTALRDEPTPDPQLPSSALGQTSFSSKDFAHQEPAQTGDDSFQPTRERLQSPGIPEPMDVDVDMVEFTDPSGRRAIRGSHSPPLPPESFISPMAILQPTTATEKAAWNDAEVLRIENSASPSASPQHIPDDQQGYDGSDEEDEGADNDEDGGQDMIADGYGGQVMGADYNVLPAIQEPVQHDGPSDYSTPGRSSTNPSSGRTPDTTITPSPSPGFHGFVQPESSASPETGLSLKPPYKCEECGRQFDQIHKLNHHKRYHDRKHECTYPNCDRKFGTKTHLDRHINDKHEKKKGYHCTEPSCPYFKGGKAFPRKDNWRRHMQNKHDLSPTPELEAAAGA
ncbi:uncharacterized protein BCR38DRAFT_407301 [Pseudomassariella vexata]|uniref:C2H2 type master regulator of conidiophore development brlA n=1 Tax=Pseudomassariella vexata TaxID=1141098 RepID=A0A1Y2E6Y4_9PEZI|nr:uncharacterized protein BCR38DRAFT_407301 [Pseudomassariella vexata]ORY67318.1 hypothetical protein BCR38DRAFT_407301 [Pseudomassariella vexata]